MVLARWKASGYSDNSNSRKLKNVTLEVEETSSLEPVMEQDFKPQPMKIMRGSTNSSNGSQASIITSVSKSRKIHKSKN